jgi:hypothetical protein
MPKSDCIFKSEIMHRTLQPASDASLESRGGSLHLRFTRASRMPVEGGLRGGGRGEWSLHTLTSDRSALFGGPPGATTKEKS